MNFLNLKRSLAALTLALGVSTAPLALAAPNNFAPVVSAAATAQDQPNPGRAQRMLRIASDPALAAISQMRMIERIYLRQNQKDEAQRMYRDVLTRTQSTLVRNFVNHRLAKLAAWQPRDLDGVLVELKRGLDENLAKVP